MDRFGKTLHRNQQASLIQPHRLILAIIIVVAASFRFVGTKFGLPTLLWPDEFYIVESAVEMTRRNSFEPTVFYRPDHLEIKLNVLAQIAYSSLFENAPAEVVFDNNPATFYWIARLITALFGIAIVVLAYFIGNRFSRSTGLVAAAVFAVFPNYVSHSHYATPDVPLTFAFMLVIYFCMRYIATPSWSSLLWASFGVALAISIKYPGALASLTIAIAVTVAAIRDKTWRRFFTHATASMAAVIGFLFAISPVLFTNAYGVAAAIRREARDTHIGADGLGWLGNLDFYSTTYLTAAGILLTIAGFIGIYWSIKLRKLEAVVLPIGFIVWIILSELPLHWERWGLPMFISPLIFAAIGITHSVPWFRETTWRRSLGWVLAGAITVHLFTGAFVQTANLVLPDTRVTSKTILKDIGATAENTIYEGYTPFRSNRPGYIFDTFFAEDEKLLVRDNTTNSLKFVMTSSRIKDRFFAEVDRYQTERDFYAALFEQYEHVLTIEPTKVADRSRLEPLVLYNLRWLRTAIPNGVVGPTIEVFKIPTPPPQ